MMPSKRKDNNLMAEAKDVESIPAKEERLL